MKKQAAGTTSSPDQEMPYLDKMLMLDRKDREGGQLSADDVATLTRFRAHLRDMDSVMLYDDELGRYWIRDRQEGERDAVFVGAMPSTAAPAKAPTAKIKLGPVVAGVTLLMIVLAGFDVQREQDAKGRHLIALLEWQRDGGVDPMPIMEQLPVWPGMLVGLCVIILASCLAVWVVRKVRTRRSRPEHTDPTYRTVASGDSVQEVLDQLHDLSPALRACW